MANEASALVGDAGISGTIDPVSDSKNLQFKVRDVKGATNYTAGGIAIGVYNATAATNLTNTLTALGFSKILGAICLAQFNSADGATKTTGWGVIYQADSGRLQLMTAGAAGTGDVEATGATDVSAFTFRMLFIGVPV